VLGEEEVGSKIIPIVENQRAKKAANTQRAPGMPSVRTNEKRYRAKKKVGESAAAYGEGKRKRKRRTGGTSSIVFANDDWKKCKDLSPTRGGRSSVEFALE